MGLQACLLFMCLIYLPHFLPCQHSLFVSYSFPECKVSINSLGVQIIVSRFCVNDQFPLCGLHMFCTGSKTSIKSFCGCVSEFTCYTEIFTLQQLEKVSYLPLLLGETAKGNTFLSMASSVFIVHSLPLFTNWCTLWTARCDQAPNVTPHSCLWSLCNQLQLKHFLAQRLFSRSFCLCESVSPSLPLSPNMIFNPCLHLCFLTGLFSRTKANIHPVTKHGKSKCCF